MTYLLVEDEEEVRETFQEYNAEHPELICLGVADSVEDALEKTLRLRPQAVILDLQLIESNGEDYLVRLKKMRLKEPPCVLVLTNIKEGTTHAQIGDYGASRIICKGERRYLREGPKFVFDVLWTKHPYFKVKLNMERPLPIPEKPETIEETRERVRGLCLEYSDKQRGKGMDYFIHLVAAIIAGKNKKYVVKNILEDVVSKEFDGADEHTLYVGVGNYTTYLWDNPGKRGLKEEYEQWFNVSMGKGMPPLTNLIPFFIKQL